MSELPLDRFLELAGAPEQTLPNGCIEPVDLAGWQRFLAILSDWQVLLDDNLIERQLSTEDLGSLEEPKMIKVWPLNRAVQVNVFPGTPGMVLFDFATRELVDQQAADALAEFIRRSGQATQTPVHLSIEGDDSHVFATYDPRTDRFTLA